MTNFAPCFLTGRKKIYLSSKHNMNLWSFHSLVESSTRTIYCVDRQKSLNKLLNKNFQILKSTISAKIIDLTLQENSYELCKNCNFVVFAENCNVSLTTLSP